MSKTDMANMIDAKYAVLLSRVFNSGVGKGDRTGTGTQSLFGLHLNVDLVRDGFPLISLKAMKWAHPMLEMIWFMRGRCNAVDLQQQGINIWNSWATEDGDLGPVYGRQMRSWQTPDGPVDQLQVAIDLLRTNPDSRRIIIEHWNVADLPDERLSPQDNVDLGKMALAPCHKSIQFYTAPQPGTDRRALSIKVEQRSSDVFLGLPYNVAQYAFFLSAVARHVGMDAHRLIFSLGDTHIYNNHRDQCSEVIDRDTANLLQDQHSHPKLVWHCAPEKPLWDITADDFEIVNYNPLPTIHGKVSV